MFKKSPQITQILTNKYIFVIIRVICGRKNLLMFFCYSVFKIKHKKKRRSKKRLSKKLGG